MTFLGCDRSLKLIYKSLRWRCSAQHLVHLVWHLWPLPLHCSLWSPLSATSRSGADPSKPPFGFYGTLRTCSGRVAGVIPTRGRWVCAVCRVWLRSQSRSGQRPEPKSRRRPIGKRWEEDWTESDVEEKGKKVLMFRWPLPLTCLLSFLAATNKYFCSWLTYRWIFNCWINFSFSIFSI